MHKEQIVFCQYELNIHFFVLKLIVVSILKQLIYKSMLRSIYFIDDSSLDIFLTLQLFTILFRFIMKKIFYKIFTIYLLWQSINYYAVNILIFKMPFERIEHTFFKRGTIIFNLANRTMCIRIFNHFSIFTSYVIETNFIVVVSVKTTDKAVFISFS